MRNQSILLTCLGLIVALSPTWVLADDGAAPHQNLEGVSGLLTTPTAEVINDGKAAYSESRFRIRRILNWNDAVVRNYMVTIGYLPGLEITARFADFPELPDTMGSPNFQDRSVSAKYQLFSSPDWQVAFGGTKE